MPETNLETMWKEVQHKTDAPEFFKQNCLKLIGGHWKKWKSRVKSDYFTPNKDDQEKLMTAPEDSRIDPTQWPSLVNYWQSEKVQAQALRNSQNRKQLEYPPRTGRTSHANIREEMKARKEDISRANVFIKTSTRNDGTIPDNDTRMVVERMKEKLSEVPESEQTEKYKEEVFVELVGPDGHGRVKTFGVGPSRRDIFGTQSSSMNVPSSDAIQMMVQSQVEEQLEAKVAERVAEQVAQQVAEKVVEKTAHYEEKLKELKERIDNMNRLLVLDGLLPPSQSNETRKSGSSVGQVQTPPNEG